VKTSGDYGSVEEIADTAVRSVDGRTVRVRDVASVAQANGEATHLVRFDGKRAVLIAANQREKQPPAHRGGPAAAGDDRARRGGHRRDGA
jgi:multidrug efflux pump subunit AcrB